MYKILVVEDNETISRVVMKYLKIEGFECDLVKTGLEALELFSQRHYHLIILDVMMPGIDGFDVLEQIREISNVPIIMLTAKKSEVDRLKGFGLGADDYVIKPFSPKELMSRVNVFLTRVYGSSDELIETYGPFKLILDSLKCYKNNIEIELTTAEFNILATFIKNKNIVLTREQLINQIYGYDYEGIDRNIDGFIKRLRKKIEDDPKNPIFLKTKYGKGYVFGGDN